MKNRFLVTFFTGVLAGVPCAIPYSVPRIIQGGMGIRISSWKLAREVSRKGELGVISGSMMDVVLTRSLQKGDPDGAMRRALATFPDQDMVDRLMDKYFIKGGKDATKPYKNLPMWSLDPPQSLLETSVLANYCEVWLAKHDDNGSPVGGLVGMNLLTKVQLPTIPSLYGAMLADVDYIIMGAGIPLKVPGILDALSECKDCKLPIDVMGAEDQPSLTFSPSEFWGAAGKPHLAEMTLKRPAFVPIVSSVVLAQSMLKRADGAGPTKGIQGFVVELPTAGGHNAPPRGFRYDPVAKTHSVDLNENGEPVYGPKDEVDLHKFSKATKGLPFWLAGKFARPDKFCDVLALGGAGVQVGTNFALCEESGMDDDMKQRILTQLAASDLEVFTDPAASPTGFPFKVLELENSLANEDRYLARPRMCNLGYLRTPYIRPDGKVGYRCPSEPVSDWQKKGGEVEATKGRKCLCNALAANAGYPQVSPKKKAGETENYIEDMLITIGDDVNSCRRFMKQDENGRWSFSAGDVIDYLKSEWEKEETASKTKQLDPAAEEELLSQISQALPKHSAQNRTFVRT